MTTNLHSATSLTQPHLPTPSMTANAQPHTSHTTLAALISGINVHATMTPSHRKTPPPSPLDLDNTTVLTNQIPPHIRTLTSNHTLSLNNRNPSNGAHHNLNHLPMPTKDTTNLRLQRIHHHTKLNLRINQTNPPPPHPLNRQRSPTSRPPQPPLGHPPIQTQIYLGIQTQ